MSTASQIRQLIYQHLEEVVNELTAGYEGKSYFPVTEVVTRWFNNASNDEKLFVSMALDDEPNIVRGLVDYIVDEMRANGTWAGSKE